MNTNNIYTKNTDKEMKVENQTVEIGIINNSLANIKSNNQVSINNSLVKNISKVLIIAYKESTEQLEKIFTQAGFECEVLRQENKPEYQNYSHSYLCLMNHCRAWETAATETKPTLIIEADFVPVFGIAKLPLQFDPNQSNVGVSWLYTCAPQIYSISPQGHAEGFSVSTVAYIVTPLAAKTLLGLADEVTQKHGNKNYSSWDSTLDKYLRDRNFKNYIPWRNYGEHGGAPNPEHHQHQLSKTHRADVLYGKLAFTPIYAANQKNPVMAFFSVRFQARCKGIARLLLGRFLRPKIVQNSKTPGKLIRFALFRHFSCNRG
ncbi:LPS biosynthesis glycosyltransferase [Brunnivagina elsteri]|uniref:LPS biosynthesis glycosyltransferase n=1 Tax=Brunnivagina elsteri TaxID=1247191 RepID=UPI001FE5AE3D|nr:LPS biosynthesis glycosyltransferase [Calothrix elsteri]